ncbi:hypothetical protein LC593_08345 [Nostoc sp. CHAB 5844]|nr:hypothetical protein [Nostoc sp. CHAB 5844]
MVVIKSPSVAQALRVVTVAIDISPGFFSEPNQPKLHSTLNGSYNFPVFEYVLAVQNLF